MEVRTVPDSGSRPLNGLWVHLRCQPVGDYLRESVAKEMYERLLTKPSSVVLESAGKL